MWRCLRGVGIIYDYGFDDERRERGELLTSQKGNHDSEVIFEG